MLQILFRRQRFCSEISSSSDDSDYVERTSATKTVKKKNLQRKLNRGEEIIVADSLIGKQPTVNSSQDSAATSTRIEQKHRQKREPLRKSKLENKNDANKKELGDVTMKLERKRPM